jgi:hypothetical protein
LKIILDSQEYSFLIPADVELVRVGNNTTDGGYVIPESLVDSVDGLLSLGLGDDWSFDDHFHQLNPDCVVHAYDSTITPDQFDHNLLTQYNKTFKGNVRHFCENIGKQFIKPDFTELTTAIERLGKDNIFIKMDIEGGEYTLTKDICSHRSTIAGLVVEYHGAASTSKHCFLEELPVLTEYYQVVHVHANNSGPIINGFPDYLEISFMRKDLCLSNQLRFSTYIDHLDRPCSIFCDDYRVYFSKD